MSKLEKRLCIFAIIFVIIYIGAIVLTIQSKVAQKHEITRLESAQAAPGEGHLMLAELFLPMLILFTIAVCFIIVKRKRDKARQRLEDPREDLPK